MNFVYLQSKVISIYLNIAVKHIKNLNFFFNTAKMISLRKI